MLLIYIKLLNIIQHETQLLPTGCTQHHRTVMLVVHDSRNNFSHNIIVCCHWLV